MGITLGTGLSPLPAAVAGPSIDQVAECMTRNIPSNVVHWWRFS